jgi:predicted nucleic-acid-binding protein
MAAPPWRRLPAVRAVDTNGLARYYLQDDIKQARAAARLLAAGDVFIPKTVILELEWVLRWVAEQPPAKVVACLEHLIDLPGVIAEDYEQVQTALDHCRRGIDFADALHHASSMMCNEVLTFDDRGYSRRATRLGLKPPVRLLKT